MRVPIRKSEKYTTLKTDPHITQAKFNELKIKLDRLVNINRPKEAEEVKRLALMGDFSENAAYQIAKGRLRGINQRILDISNLLGSSEIIQADGNNEYVQIGNFITLLRDNKEKVYQILGSEETNPGAGIISHSSPLGAALMGKKVGDIIKVVLPEKVIEYKIIKIA